MRERALVVPDKAHRVHNFHHHTLHALQELVQAAGLQHPGEVNAHHVMRRVTDTEVRSLADLLPQVKTGALLGDDLDGLPEVFRAHWATARAERFAA